MSLLSSLRVTISDHNVRVLNNEVVVGANVEFNSLVEIILIHLLVDLSTLHASLPTAGN
jgi:hypothetical protein